MRRDHRYATTTILLGCAIQWAHLAAAQIDKVPPPLSTRATIDQSPPQSDEKVQADSPKP